MAAKARAELALACLLANNFLWLTASGGELKMQESAAVYRPEVVGPQSRDAVREDWPSTFVFLSEGGTQCTATAIGDRVLLTAAHCLLNTLNGTIQVAETKLNVSCEKHSNYPQNAWADFALCITDASMPKPKPGFEVVNTDPGFAQTGASLKLVGFGCRTPGGADRGFGRLAEGDAIILLAKTEYIETGGGAAICTGDSGGGAFVTINTVPSQRRLVGVNSVGDLYDRSYIPVTSSDLFLVWARAWLSTHATQICGLSEALMSCRQTSS